MLLVKTKIGPSSIQGTGLFADEFIPKDTPVWKFDPLVDESFSREEVEALPEPKRAQVLSLFHSYVSRYTGKYILCGDDAVYFNHSDTPNVVEDTIKNGEGLNIAAHDIQKGEELTNDYRAFDPEGINFGFAS